MGDLDSRQRPAEQAGHPVAEMGVIWTPKSYDHPISHILEVD
jgi:hypothetical protein